jgi:hypothetical protein
MARARSDWVDLVDGGSHGDGFGDRGIQSPQRNRPIKAACSASGLACKISADGRLSDVRLRIDGR